MAQEMANTEAPWRSTTRFGSVDEPSESRPIEAAPLPVFQHGWGRHGFVAGGYWSVDATLAKAPVGESGMIHASLTHVGNFRIATNLDFDKRTGRLKKNLVRGRDIVLLDERAATELANELRAGTWSVIDLETCDDTGHFFGPGSPSASQTARIEGQCANRVTKFLATGRISTLEQGNRLEPIAVKPSPHEIRPTFHFDGARRAAAPAEKSTGHPRTFTSILETMRRYGRETKRWAVALARPDPVTQVIVEHKAREREAARPAFVAVRLVVQRERERLDFVAGGYWDVDAALVKVGAANDGCVQASLTRLDGVRVASRHDFDESNGSLKSALVAGHNVVLLDERSATGLASDLRAGAWSVADLETREESRRPAAPFTTSTLQQEASRTLGWSARDTMHVAQALYEHGHITCMRTHSTNLAPEALDAIRATVGERYGADHLPEAPRIYAKATKNAQEAHEAIRPAGIEMRTADELGLRDRDAALYDLVWKRTVASQMADARLRFVTARIEGRSADRVASFRATGSTIVFAGFQRTNVVGSDDPDRALNARQQPLPALKQGDRLEPITVQPNAHETKPPARFTEATLVKTLEETSIGPPMMFASILDTIQQLGCVRKVGGHLVPTFTGFAINALLEHQFPHEVDERFTAGMEDDQDTTSTGPNGIANMIESELAELDASETSTIAHPKWAPFVVRVGRNGPYVEGEVDGEVLKASLPDDVVPADLGRDDLERLLRDSTANDAPRRDPGANDASAKVTDERLGSWQDEAEATLKRAYLALRFWIGKVLRRGE